MCLSLYVFEVYVRVSHFDSSGQFVAVVIIIAFYKYFFNVDKYLSVILNLEKI